MLFIFNYDLLMIFYLLSSTINHNFSIIVSINSLIVTLRIIIHFLKSDLKFWLIILRSDSLTCSTNPDTILKLKRHHFKKIQIEYCIILPSNSSQTPNFKLIFPQRFHNIIFQSKRITHFNSKIIVLTQFIPLILLSFCSLQKS